MSRVHTPRVVCPSTMMISTSTPSYPGNMSRYASEDTSHTLDGNPRGVHVDKDDFDTAAKNSGSRVMSMKTSRLSCNR